jgi:amino acid transporter
MIMAQESVSQQPTNQTSENEHSRGRSPLGPILCWAVVFADIGTSVYYVPGILYNTNNIRALAGFFVFLTMSVFVLLTLKYAEVTHRFPQGGGVVTVGAQAMNKWFGALGGMFILVDYFLTAAISSLSGTHYLSVVIPAFGPTLAVPVVGQVQVVLILITIVVLALLGLLNWIGISESAKVSFVAAIIAFGSDIAILITVFTHISFSSFFSLFPSMFAHRTLTPAFILIGYAGAFLAFSGLESISQLSPVMRTPRKRVAGIALLIVVLTIGITSPLLTMLSTILLPRQAGDPELSTQLISLLAGKWGGVILQTEVAISASTLLIFASNTAIIGTYHVFIALARMDFFPPFLLQRNKLRGTPHYSILLATGIPILILVLVFGKISILADLYAFGLLGAFSLTCIGVDIVRFREHRLARPIVRQHPLVRDVEGRPTTHDLQNNATEFPVGHKPSSEATSHEGLKYDANAGMTTASKERLPLGRELKHIWHGMNFWLGILTTVLVITAWSTNLITKPLATVFGGSVAIVGMVIAYFNHRRHEQKGHVPVVYTHAAERMPDSILAVLTPNNGHNTAIMRTAIEEANGKPIVFLYVGAPQEPQRAPRLFELVDPYLDDQKAREAFGQAEALAQKAKVAHRFVYQQRAPGGVSHIWKVIHPHDTVIAAEETPGIEDINPDRIRYVLTPDGKIAHLLKHW